MKTIEKQFNVVLSEIFFKMVLTLEFVDKILGCDNFNESYLAFLYLVRGFFFNF